MPQGNVSEALKQRAHQLFRSYVIGDRPGSGFGNHVGRRIEIMELTVSLRNSKATTVCEVVVEQDMLDTAQGALHDGCSAYIIDMCTALPYIALGLAQSEAAGPGSKSKFDMAPFAPSQRLDVTFHNPTCLGARLRVICESIANNGPILTVWGEIWDLGENRIVASATHTKVMPKKPPPAANLKL